MTAQQVAVKKYIVKLSAGEREQLNTLIRTGKHRARQLRTADAATGFVQTGVLTFFRVCSGPVPGPFRRYGSRLSRVPS